MKMSYDEDMINHHSFDSLDESNNQDKNSRQGRRNVVRIVDAKKTNKKSSAYHNNNSRPSLLSSCSTFSTADSSEYTSGGTSATTITSENSSNHPNKNSLRSRRYNNPNFNSHSNNSGRKVQNSEIYDMTSSTHKNSNINSINSMENSGDYTNNNIRKKPPKQPKKKTTFIIDGAPPISINDQSSNCDNYHVTGSGKSVCSNYTSHTVATTTTVNNNNSGGVIWRPTEAQLRWAQFQRKQTLANTRHKVEALYQTPLYESLVPGATASDGNTSEESFSEKEDSDKDNSHVHTNDGKTSHKKSTTGVFKSQYLQSVKSYEKEKKLCYRYSSNSKKKRGRRKKASSAQLSRGRRALLRISARQTLKRSHQIQQFGYQMQPDDDDEDDDDNGEINDEEALEHSIDESFIGNRGQRPLAQDELTAALGTVGEEATMCSGMTRHTTATTAESILIGRTIRGGKKRRKKKNRLLRSGNLKNKKIYNRPLEEDDEERVKRFEQAYLAMMEMTTLPNNTEGMEQNNHNGGKKWQRDPNVSVAISIDGRSYDDLQRTPTIQQFSKNKSQLLLRAQNTAPTDKGASWLIHLPAKQPTLKPCSTTSNSSSYPTIYERNYDLTGGDHTIFTPGQAKLQQLIHVLQTPTRHQTNKCNIEKDHNTHSMYNYHNVHINKGKKEMNQPQQDNNDDNDYPSTISSIHRGTGNPKTLDPAGGNIHHINKHLNARTYLSESTTKNVQNSKGRNRISQVNPHAIQKEEKVQQSKNDEDNKDIQDQYQLISMWNKKMHIYSGKVADVANTAPKVTESIRLGMKKGLSSLKMFSSMKEKTNDSFNENLPPREDEQNTSKCNVSTQFNKANLIQKALSKDESSSQTRKKLDDFIRESGGGRQGMLSHDTIIDTDGSLSEMYHGMDKNMIMGSLTLSPTVLTKRFQQAVSAIECHEWEQLAYLLSANPWLSEMMDVRNDQYLLHHLAFHGCSNLDGIIDSDDDQTNINIAPSPEYLNTNLINAFPSAAHKFDENGNLPLHMAAMSGNFEMVRLLGEQFPSGASVKNHDGLLPIHLAIVCCAAPDVDNMIEPPSIVVKAILNMFPSAITVPDNSGNLPLHLAAALLTGEIGVDVITMLMEEELNLEKRGKLKIDHLFVIEDDDENSEASSHLSTKMRTDCFESCDQCLNLVKNSIGLIPILCAIQNNSGWEIVETISLSKGGVIALKQTDGSGRNALQKAISAQNSDPASVLSILKVAPQCASICDRDGILPIEMACFGRMREEIIMALVLVDLPFDMETQADDHQRDWGGESWWYLTCYCDDAHVDVVKEVLSLCTYEQTRFLCFMKGKDGCSLITRASPKCRIELRRSLRFMGRFEFISSKAVFSNKSLSLKIFEAVDFGNEDEHFEDGRKVFLECYARKDIFDEETTVIQNIQLNQHLLEEVYHIPMHDMVAFAKQDIKQFCIAVERPQLYLSQVVAGMPQNHEWRQDSERLKRYVSKVSMVVRTIGKGIKYLHDIGIVHGRIYSGSCGKFGNQWKLTGLTGVQKIGCYFNHTRVNHHSPPEAFSESEQNSSIILPTDKLMAKKAIDFWAFGKVLFEALTGEDIIKMIFTKDVVVDDNITFEFIYKWNSSDVGKAVNCLTDLRIGPHGVELISQCLCPNPDGRPQSMDEILNHPFWNSVKHTSTIDQQGESQNMTIANEAKEDIRRFEC